MCFSKKVSYVVLQNASFVKFLKIDLSKKVTNKQSFFAI